MINMLTWNGMTVDVCMNFPVRALQYIVVYESKVNNVRLLMNCILLSVRINRLSLWWLGNDADMCPLCLWLVIVQEMIIDQRSISDRCECQFFRQTYGTAWQWIWCCLIMRLRTRMINNTWPWWTGVNRTSRSSILSIIDTIQICLFDKNSSIGVDVSWVCWVNT
jgi:hypothetical protein